jgi:DNA-binding transcriptional regulator GbsR (MarR family)
MSDHLKVEGHEGLVRDTTSKAIINTDRNAYEVAKRRAEEAQRQRDEMRETAREINTLKCEMHEIKHLLQELIKNK